LKKAFLWIAVSGAVIAPSAYYGKHFLKPKQLQVVQRLQEADSTPHEKESTPAASQDAEQMVIVVGPLAQWMQNGKPQQQDKPESAPEIHGQAGAAEDHGPHKVYAGDHIVQSTLNTTGVVVQKTLSVATEQNVPFEIPPHVVSPQLHGRYKSFVQQQGSRASNASANIDFLLMNQQQYSDFVDGRPAGALFSVDASHDQAVNLGLPPSMDQPMKYYLVFRGSKSGERTVEANFKIDF